MTFFTGVPDSYLNGFCNYALHHHSERNIITANEGNAIALAAGHYLATKEIPLVYMQNSGEGNAVNPLVSLADRNVYAIPMIFVVGWRGEPGIHDEPQHIYQGEVTLELLKVMGIPYMVISKDTTTEEVRDTMKEFRPLLEQGKNVALWYARAVYPLKKRSNIPTPMN